MRKIIQIEAVNILLISSQTNQEQIFREIFVDSFPAWRISIDRCWDAANALELLQPGKLSYSLVIVEEKIADMDGLKFCRKINKLDLPLPVLFILEEKSGFDLERRIIEVLEAGVHDYIIKDRDNRYIKKLPLVVRKVILNFKNCIFRKRAEASMREYQEKFFKAFIMSPNAIIITTLKTGCITEANEAAARQTGFSRDELIGKTLIELGIITLEQRKKINKLLEENKYYNNIEMSLKNRFQEARVCLMSGHAISLGGEKCVIETASDITLQKKIQEELLKNRNLESIGILAGGIARDFNDYLTSIMGNISIAKMSLHDTGKIHRSLNRAEDISLKAAELASKLLTFSEGGEPIRKKNSLSKIIKDIIDFRFSESKVTFNYHEISDLWPVYADESQVNQIFYNIFLNSIQALQEKEMKGEINIKTENLPVSQDNEFSLPEGKYVKVSIEDNGVGIPEKNMNKIFDPFFSTKNMSHRQALGLGLTTCLSIIKKHNGTINVNSLEGKGTKITIYIPAYNDLSSSSI